ncbi:MAG: aldehyde dehydrogenase family protein, partial [Hyphomicrobium sp.]|nr:aldehyde dehydrogenase family protein [Hyphomicrobium sp.]
MLDHVHIDLPERRLLIHGAWTDAANSLTFNTSNPATGEVITQIAEAGVLDIDAAVISARRALDEGPWPQMTGVQRGRILRRLADFIEQDRENLVVLEALDAGKPLAATRRQDLPAAIDCLEYYAGWADKIAGEV